MTPRERVLASVNHKQPDKVALDFGGHRSSGIGAIAYNKLKKALGVTGGDIYVYDMVQQLAVIEPPVLDLLDVDVVEMGRGFCLHAKDWKEWTLPDGTPCKIPAYLNVEKRGADWYLLSDKGQDLAVQKDGCLYFEQCYWPLESRSIDEDDFSDLMEALGNNMWCSIASPGGHLPMTPAGLTELTAGAKALRASTDRAITSLFGGNMFEVPQFLYRMDNYLMYMGLYPEAIHRLSERLCKIYMDKLEKWLAAVGPYIDILCFGDDLGGQNGPLMSPNMYREYYKPYHTKLWNYAKQLCPHLKVQLHCCGGVEPLLQDLIEAGLDIINPVQITCAGMDSRHLKDKFGDRMCFWGGGCDTRNILPSGTPAQIKEHVRQQIEIMNRNGGFVFQQVHNVLANVPPQNVIAMFEAVRGK